MANHRKGGIWAGVSRPVLATVLALMLVIALVAVWMKLGDSIDDDSTDAAASCLDGHGEVSIAADPAIAAALEEIARKYNSENRVIRDHCVTVDVQPADARPILDGLRAATWDQESYGPFPAAWIPESSIWSAALQNAKPTAVQGTPESLVFSPIRLAVNNRVAEAANGRIAWADLHSLTYANALRAYGLGSLGSIRLAMPQGQQADATALAGQAVVAGTVNSRGPITARQATSGEATTALNQLMSAPPKVADVAEAVKLIGDPNDDRVRAVPVTEQRLYTLTRDDKQAKVTTVAPKGGTPIADYPVIITGGDRVEPYMSETVTDFIAFTRQADHISLLTNLGFRADGQPLSVKPTTTVPFGEVTDALAPPEPKAAVDISKIVYPAAAP